MGENSVWRLVMWYSSIACIYWGDPSPRRPGLGWLGFGMFHCFAWAAPQLQYSPTACGTSQIQINPTQVREEMGHPVQGMWGNACKHFSNSFASYTWRERDLKRGLILLSVCTFLQSPNGQSTHYQSVVHPDGQSHQFQTQTVNDAATVIEARDVVNQVNTFSCRQQFFNFLWFHVMQWKIFRWP